MTPRVGIALGTNLGDRLAHLRQARDLLQALAHPPEPFLQSSIYQSEPVDCPPDSPTFFNAALEFSFSGSPEDLLALTQKIEKQLGRTPSPTRNSPRPIDLDLLYFDQLTRHTPTLTLPHPSLTARRFVLHPLTDIRPDLILPGDDLTLTTHLEHLSTPEPAPILVHTDW